MRIGKQLILSMLLMLVGMAVHGQGVYNSVINSEAEFSKYTVIDGNSDGAKWNFSTFMNAASCVRDYDADDWFITPAISFQAGKTYRVMFTAKTDYGRTNEKLTLKMGSSASVDAMNTAIGSDIIVSSDNNTTFMETFVAPTTGNGYIGFHYNTTGEMYSEYLYIVSISVIEMADQSVPAAITDLTVTPADLGELSATVSFTAPTQTAEGSSLASLTKIEVYSDNEVVKTFDNPTVGQQLSFVDAGMTNGNHTYKVVAYTAAGQSDAAEQTAFVGVDVPGAVTNLKYTYDYESHTSTITWDAPTVGANGGYINPDALTYNVRRFRQTDPLVTGMTGYSYDDEVTIDFLREAEEAERKKYEDMGMPASVRFVIDGQGLMQYYVRAVSAAGAGAETRSNYIIIGDQYELPFSESFANGALTHYWRTDITNGYARWNTLDDSRFTQDGDNGFMGFNAVDDNETTAMMHTGNISMQNAVSPILSFYYYVSSPIINPLLIKASKNDGEFETVATIDLAEDDSILRNYSLATVPLDAFAGSDYVKVAFEVTTGSGVYLIYIDNIRIIDQRGNDLSVEISSLPRTLKVGESRDAKVMVENLGTNDVAGGEYVVKAYVHGRVAGQANGKDVAAGEKVELTVPMKATIRMKKESNVYMEVCYEVDEMQDNNKSEEQAIIVKMPNLPEPTNLVLNGEGSANLTWDAPAAPRMEDGQVTESFEDYDDFQMTNFGEWTIFDVDKKLTYGIGGYSFPNNSKAMSYMIFNPSEVENSNTGDKGLTAEQWQTRTGNKMLASFAAYETESEDWLISPELSGNAQTISFYAHHITGSPVPESFYVYYSETGTDMSSFVQLDQTARNTTLSWDDKYEYNLPQGAKHFAIRKVTNDGWVMFIDDVTFSPDTLASQAGIMLSGYNIYKNGVRINEAPVAATSYVDSECAVGDYYCVTAVYTDGESQVSNYVVYAAELGVEEVEVSKSDDSIKYDVQGRRVNDNYKGIVITNGKKLIRK